MTEQRQTRTSPKDFDAKLVRLVAVLTEAADTGRRCPGSAELVQRTGIAPRSLPYAFDRLKRQGVLRVTVARAPRDLNGGRGREASFFRRVEIVATGRSTAPIVLRRPAGGRGEAGGAGERSGGLVLEEAKEILRRALRCPVYHASTAERPQHAFDPRRAGGDIMIGAKRASETEALQLAALLACSAGGSVSARNAGARTVQNGHAAQ